MVGNIMAIIQFINLCADVYLWIDERITDIEFHKRCQMRRDLRKKYITTEKERIRLEVLREIGRNSDGSKP